MTIATQDTGATDNTTEGGVFYFSDAFFKRIEAKGAEKLPAEPEPKESEEEEERGDQTDEGTEGEEEETPTEPEEATEEGQETEEDGEDEDPEASKAKKDAGDDVIVKIKVGDKEHEVPVKDLKRLYGQEASLTRKSQEVAAQRKARPRA